MQILWIIVGIEPPWRNRLARSAVNRKVGGSSPPGGGASGILFSGYCWKRMNTHWITPNYSPSFVLSSLPCRNLSWCPFCFFFLVQLRARKNSDLLWHSMHAGSTWKKKDHSFVGGEGFMFHKCLSPSFQGTNLWTFWWTRGANNYPAGSPAHDVFEQENVSNTWNMEFPDEEIF